MIINSSFKFAIFEFKTTFLQDCNLPPYKGSTIRGALGHNIKKLFCTSAGREPCVECLKRRECPYSYIFETPSSEDFKLLSNYPSVPHPFIIEPSEETKRDYKKGDTFNFNLILIGKGIDYFPYFIYLLEQTGKSGLGRDREGKYVIKSIVNYNIFFNDGITVFSSEDNILKTPSHIIGIKEINSVAESLGDVHKITFNFLTPARIKYRENPVNYLEFHIFMRSFLRRLSSLYYFHCGEELNINPKELIEKSKSIDMVKSNLYWEDWERCSARNGRMNLGGFKGEITFRGDFKEFLIFVLLGKYLHIGQATTFGLGRYDLKF